MNFKDYLDIITSLISLIGVFFFIYLYFRGPDEKADKQLGVITTNCNLKHGRLDEIILEMRDRFKSIDNSIILIKENDIRHIEQEMRRMSDTQTKILTILEYREGVRVP